MNRIQFSHKEQEKYSTDSILEESHQFDLVLFNDDVNTFEWVIECLMDVCQHDSIQAEQSAYIVHFKGKCTVKSGEWDELKIQHRELSERGLSVEVQ